MKTKPTRDHVGRLVVGSAAPSTRDPEFFTPHPLGSGVYPGHGPIPTRRDCLKVLRALRKLGNN